MFVALVLGIMRALGRFGNTAIEIRFYAYLRYRSNATVIASCLYRRCRYCSRAMNHMRACGHLHHVILSNAKDLLLRSLKKQILHGVQDDMLKVTIPVGFMESEREAISRAAASSNRDRHVVAQGHPALQAPFQEPNLTDVCSNKGLPLTPTPKGRGDQTQCCSLKLVRAELVEAHSPFDRSTSSRLRANELKRTALTRTMNCLRSCCHVPMSS